MWRCAGPGGCAPRSPRWTDCGRWAPTSSDRVAPQLDPLRLTVDVRGVGVSGYRAVDWLRAACQVDMGSADQCHLGAQISHADVRTEQVPVEQAAGRIAAGTVSPYPPGVPVLVPGELINDAALTCLTSGVQAGMLIPDAADPTMKSVRVVA